MDQDFLPSANWSTLRSRADLLRRLRSFFERRGFLEVETPLLSSDTVVDRHLDPMAVPQADGSTRWLQTSPEFGMKRLLAASPDADLRGIYQITRAFRAGERGGGHNPEFTILEWYELGADYQQGRDRLAELAGHVFSLADVDQVGYRSSFLSAVGLDPFLATTEQLRTAARQSLAAAPELPPEDRDSWLDLLLAERVERTWNQARPVIVYDYPASQAALARVELQGEVDVARRFELYFRGWELANGYFELLDPELLLQRHRHNNLRRQSDGKTPLPEGSRLIDAMRSGIPPCCGVAVGVDRLLMALLAAKHIDQVLAFPHERA